MKKKTEQQSSVQTYRNPITNKISLKNVRYTVGVPDNQSQHNYPISNNYFPSHQVTEKSTTCQSVYGGSNKQSIKNLLIAARSRNHCSENYISMTYEDIKVAMQPKKQQSFFDSLLCGIRGEVESIGCQCGGKTSRCPWMDHWISLSMKNMLYQHPKFYPVPKQIQEQIKKDIKRSQPTSKTFGQLSYQQALYQSLYYYASMDTQVGYVQGMNILCSVLLYHNLHVNQCIQVFKFLMASCDFRRVYLFDFQYANKISDNLLQHMKYRCFDLYRHVVQRNNVNLRIFIVGWVLPMLGNVVPLTNMHMVVNCFIEKGWQGLMKIILSLLLFLRPFLLQLQEETQIMQQLSIQGLRKINLAWQQIIISSHNIKILNFTG